MRKTVSIIGAGRVGRELGRRLQLLGWRVGAVVTRTPASARAAVKWIGAGSAQTALSREALNSDLLLIAVPDRAIADVATKLVGFVGAAPRVRPQRAGDKGRHAGLPLRGVVVLHTSGSLSHEGLAPLAKTGAAIGAMHPMQTFGRAGKPDFAGTVFGLDGDARAVRVAGRIARALGGTPVEIDPRKKAAYHCAGGFAAQHILAVLETGVKLLTDSGLTRKQAVRSLTKMAHQTLNNLEQHGPAASWSGPVARGDFSTIARHIKVLKRYPRDFLAAYVSLTRLVIQLVAKNPRVLKRLNRVIEKPKI